MCNVQYRTNYKNLIFCGLLFLLLNPPAACRFSLLPSTPAETKILLKSSNGVLPTRSLGLVAIFRDRVVIVDAIFPTPVIR